MKKLLSLCLSIMMVLSVFAPIANAETTTMALSKDTETGTYENLKYSVESDGNITITGTVSTASGAVTIPATIDSKSVTAIGEKAFYQAENLTSVSLPASLKTIGNSAFECCFSLGSIDLKNVETIGNAAFKDSGLVNVTLPASVKTISDEAFSTFFLETITFNEGLTSIGAKAFSLSSLTTVALPASLQTIGAGAFSGCFMLSSITVASGSTSFSAADGILFNADMTRLVAYPSGIDSTSYSIPVTVTALADQAFAGNSYLESVHFPAALADIGSRPFIDCMALREIDVHMGSEVYSSYDGILYTLEGDTLIICPPATTEMDFIIPDYVTTIADYAFEGCYMLELPVLPDALTTIGDYAFANCSSMLACYLSDNVTSIGESAFLNCGSMSVLEIGSGITALPSEMISGCFSLEEFTIPANVTSIDDSAFSGCLSLAKLSVAEANTTFDAIDGVLFNEGATTLIKYPCSKADTSYTIPSTVTTISAYAFDGCYMLETLTIPDSVTTIDDYAFANCDALQSCTLSNNVTSVGEYAFFNCGSMSVLEIGSGITAIPEGMFSGCSSLATISIPAGITSIADYAFDNCTSLTTISVADANTTFDSIDGVLFNEGATTLIKYPYAKADTEYTIPSTVTIILAQAFTSTRNLVTLNIPASVSTIGNEAFSYPEKLQSIKFSGTQPANVGFNILIGYTDREETVDFFIYYPASCASSWAPNGETTWHSYPIAAYNDGSSATVAPATTAPVVTDDPSGVYPTPHPAFSTIANGATFTVAQIAEAASGIISHYETYQELESEHSIPKAVVINNQIISDQDWVYLSGYALAGIAGSWDPSGLSGYTPETTVAYKKCTPPALNANATYTADTLSIDKVVEIAWKTTNFANSNNGVMAASCGSAFPGYQVSYYSGLLAAARALAYYSANGTLPTSVQYDKVSFIIADSDSNVAPEATAAPTTAAPTVAPTTAAPTVAPTTAAPTEQPTGATYQRKNILYAAYSINKYLTNNPATFPNYSSIDGNTVYMPGVLELIAQVIVDTNNGSTADVIKEVVAEKETSYEQLTAGSLTKAEYVELALGVLNYIAESGVAPGMMTTSLGTLSFETTLSVLANVATTLRSTGVLPASVEVAAWGKPLPVPPEVHATEFELSNVLNAARSTYNYVTTNNKYPNYTSIVAETGTEKVYMFETLGVYAQMIVNLNNGDTGVVTRNDATFFETAYENITGTTLTKAEYVAAAQAVVDAINNSPISAAPGFVNTAAGALSYQTLLKIFSSIGTTYRSTKVLPESVEVTAWTGTTLPTPPAATATPEYTYLVFREILSGAVRVKNTTETLAAAPNYVTVGESRLYQGTALRMFASTVANISRGKAVNMPFMEVATPARLANETITACELTKAEYISLANRIAETIYKNNALPNYCTTTQGTMNHYSMIYMYARILDFYNTYGFLPDTIAVQPFNTYEF